MVERTPQIGSLETGWTADGNMTVGANRSVSLVTRNVYDALGNLLSRTEADGQPEARTTRYVYDAAGRQVRTIFPPVSLYDRPPTTCWSTAPAASPRARRPRPSR
ncbi:RHS repeat domain-containing protein [Achromobacter xylosoxidans]